ncbi:aminotransferase-like domain-containing protein [Helcobacillus massiliensis]|uniref:aminotransferase-like domain-containing protein n=1 Tax=Helcobacillus massiliensis TaxID=521392 RepID=UPI0025548DFB|nr:PLP-dependent aminotransferase family protein [Helcobacillus massiliensis]MDK7742109.1 PLP-dependent aminotransferase family protein [Helcobacillus massiliensis]WOO93664.1 PLP-dependent aminotransferase family protein [Helcobacillus massiliensis]
MTFDFPVADRYRGLATSPVKEIFALAARPDVVSFAGGIPDPALFDLDAVRRCYDWVLTHQGQRALQYGVTEGEAEMREQAAARMSRFLPTSADQVQITSGSQEGLFIAAQALLNEGDVILVESPTYLAAVQAFAAHGARVIGVPCDDHGVLPDALEAAIGEHSPAALYLIPSFQNPTGRTMPMSRREQVGEIVLRHRLALIEDDPYGDLRFSGEALAPIASLPGLSKQTLLMNSMSKLMSPGVRIGWTRAEGPIGQTLAVAKSAISMQSSVVDQLTVARYLETEDLEGHVAQVIDVYRHRRDAMADALSGRLPDSAHITYPEGGMFLWASLGSGINAQDMLADACDAGVAYLPGWSFFAQAPDFSTLRLSFVTHSPDVIAESMDRLVGVIDRTLEQPI